MRTSKIVVRNIFTFAQFHAMLMMVFPIRYYIPYQHWGTCINIGVLILWNLPQVRTTFMFECSTFRLKILASSPALSSITAHLIGISNLQ